MVIVENKEKVEKWSLAMAMWGRGVAVHLTAASQRGRRDRQTDRMRE